MIHKGEALFYFEYLDNARSIGKNLKEISKNPFTLWCVGKIAEENDQFLAVVCNGTKNRLPNSESSYEVILKSAITKQVMVHVVD